MLFIVPAETPLDVCCVHLNLEYHDEFGDMAWCSQCGTAVRHGRHRAIQGATDACRSGNHPFEELARAPVRGQQGVEHVFIRCPDCGGRAINRMADGKLMGRQLKLEFPSLFACSET